MKLIKFYLIFIIVCVFASVNAQPQIPPVPIDEDVVVGQLDNGLKYYIRKNTRPENRADFYIVHNVGAILENDDQDGLAHFCEHMAFNGTKNFPDKGVLNFLERIGVKFGHNVNAFTGTDVTCYNLSDVPTTNESWIDSALLVLHDWSHYVSFEDEEIDAERGVIHEEWRTRRNADFRIRKKTSDVTYNNSKYAERDVIGQLDVIDNCSYETMREFYNDWYRTDLQAIIIVGDFDVEKMKEKVIALFSEIPKNENPKERYDVEIPDNEEPLIGIVTDPEAKNIMIQIYYKHDIVKPENKDQSYLFLSLMRDFCTIMLNNRFAELVQKPNPPFVVGQGYYGSLTRTKDIFALFSIATPEKEKIALSTLLAEAEKIKRYGFTISEFERTKKEFLSNLETDYKDKDNRTNNSFVWEYFSNFLTNEPIPSIDFYYNTTKKVLPFIDIEQVNMLAKSFFTDDNIVVTISGPEKDFESLPTEEEILKELENVKSLELEAYKDEMSEKPLIENIPEPGKIVKETNIEQFDATEWTLSNGVTVIFKKTDFKDDEILMSAFSFGGVSLYNLDDLPSAGFASTMIEQYGLGDFNSIDLKKVLTGKVVRVSPSIDDETEGFQGSSSVNDLETMFKLLYLYFDSPRFDEDAHNAFMERIKAYVQNMSMDPSKVFNDSVAVINADHNPRVQPICVEFLEKVEFEKIKRIYQERFADANNFTFIFVGNIDVETFKHLVETYLASLPTVENDETFKDNGVRAPEEKVVRVIKKKLEVPKSTVSINYSGDFDYDDYFERINAKVISHVLELRFTEVIREKEGGTYGVRVRLSTSKYPWENYKLTIKFDCDNEKAEKLKKLVYEEIEKIVNEGPSQTDLDKAKKYFIKKREEGLKENRFWLGKIKNAYFYGNENIKLDDYNEIIDKITIKSVKKAAKKHIDTSKYVEVLLMPEE
ncbi:MAG: insulinase family protein [Bacteroidales bacterium]|nr:insulinase family protein [Bacteroidales bacterium]